MYSINFCVGNYIQNKIEEWLNLNDIPERRSLPTVLAVRSAQLFSALDKAMVMCVLVYEKTE